MRHAWGFSLPEADLFRMKDFWRNPDVADDETLLSDSEREIVHKSERSKSPLTIFLVVATACAALIVGVLFDRYLLLNKSTVCTSYVSQSSE